MPKLLSMVPETCLVPKLSSVNMPSNLPSIKVVIRGPGNKSGTKAVIQMPVIKFVICGPGNLRSTKVVLSGREDL